MTSHAIFLPRAMDPSRGDVPSTPDGARWINRANLPVDRSLEASIDAEVLCV